MRAALGRRDGVMLIFDPRSRTLDVRRLAHLNHLANEAGVPVIAQSLVQLADAQSMATLRRELGLDVPLTDATHDRWRTRLARLRLAQPTVIVLRRGMVQAVVSGEAASGLVPPLPGLTHAVARPAT